MGLQITLHYSKDMPASPYLRRIESLALADRCSLGCRFGEPCNPRNLIDLYDVSRILESYKDYEIHFERSLEGEFGKVQRWSGVTFPVGNGNHLMMVNPNHHQVRRTFTIAHEFGHLVLGHRLIYVGSQGTIPKTRYSDDQEKEAYWYALAVLLPYAPLLQMLEQGASIRGIANHYKVSVPVVEFRLKITRNWGMAKA